MNFDRKIFLLFFALFLMPTGLSAQFYVTGDDPGKLKWNVIDTDNYSIIYPEGADSLARDYGYRLEKFRVPVSRTTGYLGGGPGKLRMPVVLHTYNTSNGSVSWAPKRMDFFTIPSAYAPEALPWSTMLSVHESRHVTQMQFGMTAAQKPFGWFLGEMWNILASLLYPGLSNIEGDAVIAETALTLSGRGRTADFLNYYKVAFDNGDFRRWDQWRLGSQRRYAPDHYALGYLTIGGFRYLYDCPMFMSDAYHLSARRPYNLAAFYTTAKKLTGKSYEDAFMEVCHTMHKVWKAEADARAPFIPMEPVSKEARLYTDYEGTTVMNNTVYSIKSGHETTPVLISIDSTGKETFLSRFSYETSGLKTAPRLNRLYWSETLPDERWTMKADSKIRYINVDKGGKRAVSPSDILLFNPDVNAESNFIASVQYTVEGESFLTVVNGLTGEILMSVAGPSGIQLVETAWIGNDIYASGLSDEGFGVYGYKDGKWSVLLEPQPVKIKDFQPCGDEIMMTCDRTGVNELYHLNPVTGELRQKTVTRYGASDFSYDDDCRYLYFSSQTQKGMRIYRTAVSDLVDRPVDFTERHSWSIAEKLAAQEKAIAMEEGKDAAVTDVTVNFSEPRKYGKLNHMFNLHSWAPFYANVDNIMNMSGDYTWQMISLGACGLLQNRLATAVGQFGYSAHKDPYEPEKWRHSAHAKLTYSGLYPVFEFSVDFNDRAARQWSPYLYLQQGGTGISLGSKAMDTPYIQGNISMYIPFDFSSGGWFRGFIPKVSYKISNDMFRTDATVLDVQPVWTASREGGLTESGRNDFCRVTGGQNTFRHSISGSVRGYTMLATPNSAIYPKWGIGVEAGGFYGLESSEYLSPMGYGYVYGYIPGIIPTHGIKLTGMAQMKLNDAPFGQAAVNILPRGLSGNSELLNWLAVRNDMLIKATVDYAFPIYIGDLALGGNLFSIKRLIINPHFDYFHTGENALYSAGAELILDLNSILTLEVPCSFGVTYSYNGGDGMERFAKESSITIDHHFVGPTFNITF